MFVNSAHAQGYVALDNYSQTGNLVVYGGGPNAIGGTIAGTGVVNGSNKNGVAGNVTWTIAVYDALGDVTGSVGSDPTGVADPSTLGGGLTFNSSATTTFNIGGAPGEFTGTTPVSITGYASGLVTFEVVAYSGSSYDSSNYRGHSTAFTLTPSTASATAPDISTFFNGMPTFSVFTVPEPSILALSGIGAAALMLFRRRVASK